MKTKIISGIIALAIVALLVFNINLNINLKSGNPSLVLANLEAMANPNENGGNTLWFSNLRWVECPISKTNGPVGIYVKGIFIGAYVTYTVYGNKHQCVREFTINTCNLADETPCKERP